MCCTGTDPSLRLSQYLGTTKGHSVAFRVRGPPTLLHWAPLPEATMITAEKTHTPGRLHMMAPCQTNEATEGMNLLTPQLGGLLYEWKGEPHVACKVQHTYCIPSVGFQSHSPAPLCYGLDLVRFGSILFSEAHSHPHSPKFSSMLVSLNLQLLRYSVAYGERIFLPAVRNVLQAVSMPWGVRALRPSAELHVDFKTESRCHCIVKSNAQKEKHYLSEVTIKAQAGGTLKLQLLHKGAANFSRLWCFVTSLSEI